MATDARRADFDGVKAIFFDLDDTLCGYWDASKAGLRGAFERHLPNDHSVDEFLSHWAAAFREFAGEIKNTSWFPIYLKTAEPSRTELMRRALKRGGIDDEHMAADLSASYRELRDRSLKLFPDAIEVLTKLGVNRPLGLITNGPADLQREEIATLGIEKFFTAIFIEGELDHGKPHELPFRLAREAVGFAPEEMLMVGNSYSHDVRPALDYGWRAVWIRRPSDIAPSALGQSSKPEERPDGSPEPTAVIHELAELLDLVPKRP